MRQNQAGKVLDEWHRLLSMLDNNFKISLDGKSLTIPALVAAAHYKASIHLENLPVEVVASIERSVQFLHDELACGESIYGVNTGFGGSANTTTAALKDLQVSLLQMQLSGVLPVSMKNESRSPLSHPRNFSNGDSISSLAMPEAWVRGAILVRCNSLLRGHSAVRLDVIKTLLKLVQHDLIPLVPLRGSISASGDLCPLSYIAGVLEGNPDVQVWTGDHHARKLVPANEALKSIGLAPISFGPKEMLGLMNGTACSVSAAALAQHQADTLLVLAQILTARGVEALLGTIESFHPFIAAGRPPSGQIEAAQNIRSFLKGSKLARNGDEDESSEGGLRQDRYGLRTSSQWLGPVLEDMSLARCQIEIELNSTTDNPLIDIHNKKVHHGGNFQATAVTSSTDKTRMALEKIGRMIFAQSTELLDSAVNNHLPPNLAADEPSLSYAMKGVDINMAAYMSELSYTANPVITHMLSAEMSNQSLNSLALISARTTHTAVDLVFLMSSAYLYTLCQALDLRAMNQRYMTRLRLEIEKLTVDILCGSVSTIILAALHRRIWATLVRALAKTTSEDSSRRFILVAQSAQYLIVGALAETSRGNTKLSGDNSNQLSLVTTWTDKAASILKTIFLANRKEYLRTPDATEYLGIASNRMYKFVRHTLDVPMHRGLVDHPTLERSDRQASQDSRRNTGSHISRIYQALRDERLMVPIMECLKEVVEMNKGERPITSKL